MRSATAIIVATLLGCSGANQPESGGERPTGDTVTRAAAPPVGSTADVPPDAAAGTPQDTGAGTGTAFGTPARAPPGGAAGTPPGTSAAGAQPVQERVLRGRIVVSGTEPAPVATLDVEGYGALILRGPLAPELRTLAGGTVAVRGTESGTRRRVLDVVSYELLEIHGERPVIGTILSDGRLATASDTLMLLGAPSEFRPGHRVWVVGDRTGGSLRVSSAGRIGTP